MYSSTIEKFRKYRTKKLGGIAQLLIKIGVTANLMTFFSLVSGLLAIYFLFDNYLYFVIFALLHLLFDSFDGVIARLTKTSQFGKYFDLIFSDSLVTFLAFVKVGWFLQDYYAYIVAGLFFLAVVIHLLSKLKAPMYFMRTATLIVLIIFTFPSMPNTEMLLTIGYLIAGIVTVYSLAKQLQWYLIKFK